MLRNKLFVLALASPALMFAGPAHAQFGGIVFDPQAFAHQLQELNEARKMVTQGAQQLDEAKKLYNDFNKVTDIGRVAQQLKNDALRSTDVSDTNIGGYTDGDLNVVGGLRGKANEAYQRIMEQLPSGASAETRTAYEQRAREAAVTAGLASNVGSSVTSRRQGLEELRTRLNSATSPAERADMQARLQLEQAQMTNDALALQAIEIQRRAKAEAQYTGYVGQRQRENAKMAQQMGID